MEHGICQVLVAFSLSPWVPWVQLNYCRHQVLPLQLPLPVRCYVYFGSVQNQIKVD